MKYPFSVYQTKVEDHVFWVAESPLLNGCVGQGETADGALRELEINEQAWLETAEEYGITIPVIPCEPLNAFSGKFTVRIAPHVHQRAAELAKTQGVSLNQYVNDAIVAQNSCISTIASVMPVVSESIKHIRLLAFANTSESDAHNKMSLSLPSSFGKKYQYKQRFAN